MESLRSLASAAISTAGTPSAISSPDYVPDSKREDNEYCLFKGDWLSFVRMRRMEPISEKKQTILTLVGCVPLWFELSSLSARFRDCFCITTSVVLGQASWIQS